METSTMEKRCPKARSKAGFTSPTHKAGSDRQNRRKSHVSKMGGVILSKIGKGKHTQNQGRKRKIEEDAFNFNKELDPAGDAVLRTDDGNSFKISRISVSRQSPFFKALFFGDFRDGTDVLLKGIDSKILERILIYLHSGIIQLRKENAADILVVSDYLLIDALVQKSRSYVLTEMTITNCILLFLTAWRIERLNLFDKCYRFIVFHFEEVVSRSEEIGSLPLEALLKFLSDKSLNISQERTVWNAIVKWIAFNMPDRLPLVRELLRYISLEDVDDILLKDILFHTLIQENRICKDLIFRELQLTDQLRISRQILNSQVHMTEPRIPTNPQLIIFNCLAGQIYNKNIYITWDGEMDYWRKIGSVHFFPDYLIQLDHHVYMFDTTLSMSLAFDIFKKECLPMTPIYESRIYYKVVSVKGFIYIMGGRRNVMNHVEDIERFETKTGKRNLVSPMVSMKLSDAVALNGLIYAIGCSDRKTMVQVYDPESDRWSSVPSPRSFNPKIAAVAFRGRLYVIGGKTGCASKTVEEYDPVRNVWIAVTDLPFSYHTPKAVVLKDFLIVYEEHMILGSCVENTPPVYWIPENRTWNVIPESSPLRMIRLFKFCSITETDIIKFTVKQNRKQGNKWVKSPFAYLNFKKLDEVLVSFSAMQL